MRRRVWLSMIAVGLLGCGLSTMLSLHLRDAERATIDLAFRRIVDERVASLERLRRRIAAESFLVAVEDGRQTRITITVSIGVATMSKHGKSGEVLIAAADHALYEAKKNGRNCTVSSTFSNKGSAVVNFGQPVITRGEVG